MTAALLVLVARAWTAPAPAPSATVLTWDACAAEAHESNPDLVAARCARDVATVRRAGAWDAWLPRVGAEASRGRRGGFPAGDTGGPSFGASLSVSQSLFAGFATMAEIASAAAEYRKAVAAYRDSEADVRHDLRESFVAALAAQELVGVRTALAARRRENLELVRARVAATKEDDSSRQTADAEVGKADFEVARARRALVRAQQKLSRIMGRVRFVPQPLAGSWVADAPPAPADMTDLAEATPRVVRALAGVDQSRAGVRATAAALWPEVDASGSLGRDGPAWPPSESRSWSTGLTISVNLFNGLRDRHALAVARLEAAQAEAELASARRGALETLEESLDPYANAFEAVAVRHTSLEAARARANDARAKYQAGALQFDQWHGIEGELADGEVEDLDARREALDAQASWERALGTGFP